MIELTKAGFNVGYTFRSSAACSNLGVGKGYAVDLCSGAGIEACLDDLGTARAFFFGILCL